MNISKVSEAILQIRMHCNNTACYDCMFNQDESDGCMFHSKPYDWFVYEKLEESLNELEDSNEQ